MQRLEIEKTKFQKERYTDLTGPDFFFQSLSDLGENVSFGIGIGAESSNLDWTFDTHIGQDGVAYLKRFLRERGYEFRSPSFATRSTLKQGFVKILSSLRYLLFRKKPSFDWPTRDFSKGLSFSNENKTKLIVTLDTDETCRLMKELKAQKTSLNGYIFKALTSFFHQDYLKNQNPDQEYLWMFPVNLHGAVENELVSSYVDVVTKIGDTPRDINSQIRSTLKRGEYWWVWHLSKIISRYFKRSTFNVVKKHILHGGPPYTGLVTNVGDWKIQGNGIENNHFVVTSTVSRVRPVGVAIITVNNKLSLSVSFHETLPVENVEEMQLRLCKLFLL